MVFSYSSPSSPTAKPTRKSYKLDTIRACSQVGSDPAVLEKICKFMDAFWRFIRPYAIKGTIVSSTCLLVRVLMENPNSIEWLLVLKALSWPFALICANSFTVGINQIYDVEIDKINKPHLPIVAGDLSVESAWLLVVFFALAGFLVVGMNCDPVIMGLYRVVLLVGAAYSIPPFRLKESPVGAILSIAFIRGYLLNFGVYYSTKTIFGLAFQWSAPLIFMTIFGTVTGTVVAIVKDLSDVEGDSKFKVPTLATRFGLRNVAYLGSGLLLFLYGCAILAAISMPQTFRRSVMIPAHLIFALNLIYQTRVLERANYNKEASIKFYMSIWNLYYAEYMIFPFI